MQPGRLCGKIAPPQEAHRVVAMKSRVVLAAAAFLGAPKQINNDCYLAGGMAF